MLCPICSTICDDDLRFCDHCGADLTKTSCGEIEEIPVVQVVDVHKSVDFPPVLPTAPDAVTESPDGSISTKGRLWPPLLIMTLMICIGTLLYFLIPQSPSPNSGSSMDYFTVENGVLSFHPEFYHGSSELVIPEQIDGITVTAIADYAFSGQDTITTVILPDSITLIGDYAFSSCSNLRGIYIPDSVTLIGVYAFADCDELEAIYLPGSLVEMGHGSLDSCNSLHYILFDGTYNQFMNLYSGYFVSTVELHAIDGVYYTRP